MATPHVVVWPVEKALLSKDALEERRHWHTACWERRTGGQLMSEVSVRSSGATRVLPARREPITLETADGLKLVGELALPARS